METTSVGPNGLRGTEGAVLVALDRIEKRLARLEGAVDEVTSAAKTAPAMLAAIGDTLDDAVRRGQDAGIDVDARLRAAASVLERMTSPRALDALRALVDRVEVVHAVLESGIFDPAAASVAGCAGTALVASAGEPAQPVGIWDAVRALRDPDIQRALAFALRFAQRFGRALGYGGCPRKQLPAGSSS